MNNKEIPSKSTVQSTDNARTTTPVLPLGWTQIKRRRKDLQPNSISDNDIYDECCKDLSCRRKRKIAAPLTLSTIKDNDLVPMKETQTLQGTSIFCLHETNPEWFQGYFFQGTTTWGMLCEQQDVDDCLQCADGGYRLLQVTLYPFSGQTDLPEKIIIPNVEWTGGDMMRLLQRDNQIQFEPRQLYTSEKAVPLTQSLFKSLLRKLQDLQKDTLEDDVLTIVPDVAIVLGEMNITLSNLLQDNH